jgi:NH3-dependent NAD+ synthetase
VRAGKSSGAQTVFSEDALDDPRGRGLAVGASDVNDSVVVLRVTHQAD